jgi:hypothetical protein
LLFSFPLPSGDVLPKGDHTVREFGSTVGVRRDWVNTSIEGTPFEPEDSHGSLLARLADGIPYDILQLDPVGDPDLIGLVVDGRLRATYRKVAVYADTSMVAQTILDKSVSQATRALSLIRNFTRAANGSVDGLTARRTGQVPASVEPEPIAWKTDEFVAPPLEDGSESAHREETTEAIPMEFDMGPEHRLIDDSLMSDTLPAFFDSVKGLAGRHEPSEEGKENGW